jgi:hypothetical protein
MKLSNIISVATALTIIINSIAIVEAHGEPTREDFKFAMDKPAQKRGRGGFGLQKAGGRLRLCPTGDCSQSVIDIAMERLIEIDAEGNLTENRAKTFKSTEYSWSTPVSALNEEGVNVTTSSFDALVPVGDVNVTYKAQVAFYAQNGTALNGKQVIDIPAGGLKFAVWIENWPFLNEKNKVRLGLRVMTRNKKGEEKSTGEKIKERKGRDRLIERVNLGDSMFLDSPVLAEIDKQMQNITSYIAEQEGFVMIEYEFPKFKTLYYDPVMSSEEALDEEGQQSGANTNIRSSATHATSSAVVTVAVLAVATGMMLL